MTTTKASPLDEVARRIAQHQAELESLRQEFERRQAQLADLSRRKEELATELAKVESDIKAVQHGTVTSSAGSRATAPHAKTSTPASPTRTTPSKSPVAKKATPVSQGRTAPAVPLPQMLVAMVRAAKRPITVKELATELVRRKFPTTSKALPQMVKTRVSELVKKGILRDAKDQPGVIPGPGMRAKPAAPSQKKQAPQAKKPSTGVPVPLKAVLTRLLEKSNQPLPGPELAKQALAAGYQSKSKEFANLVWVTLGRMDNVENIAGKGYRLKKR